MKKLLCFLYVFAIVFSFAGCFEEVQKEPFKETGSQEVEKQESTDSNLKEELVFGLNETAVFSNLKVTATSMEVSQGKNYLEPEEGNVFVGIQFTIENVSQEDQSVSSLLMFEGYVDDVKASLSFTASTVFSGGTLDGTIAPGKKLVGYYALEVPESWGTIELNVQDDWLSDQTAKFIFKK